MSLPLKYARCVICGMKDHKTQMVETEEGWSCSRRDGKPRVVGHRASVGANVISIPGQIEEDSNGTG